MSQKTITELVIEQVKQRGYTSVADMRRQMGEPQYAQLVQQLAPVARSRTRAQSDPTDSDPRWDPQQPQTIRVFLVMDPQVEVFVRTTQGQVRAKLKGIRKDIINQKFPRWAPFRGLSEAVGDGQGGRVQKPSWAWEFV